MSFPLLIILLGIATTTEFIIRSMKDTSCYRCRSGMITAVGVDAPNSDLRSHVRCGIITIIVGAIESNRIITTVVAIAIAVAGDSTSTKRHHQVIGC